MALNEFQAAVAWYQQRNPSAAERFAAAVEQVLRSIGKQPERYGWFDEEFRAAAVARYPYSVIYKVRDSGEGLCGGGCTRQPRAELLAATNLTIRGASPTYEG